MAPPISCQDRAKVPGSDRVVRMWLRSDMRSRIDGQGCDGCGFHMQLKGCKGSPMDSTERRHEIAAERDIGLYTGIRMYSIPRYCALLQYKLSSVF